MIYRTFEETVEINEYRNEALKRKMRNLGADFKGIGQFEFECLECLEHLYAANANLPYPIIVEETTERTGATLTNDEKYIINFNKHDIRKLYFYIDEIFGKQWSETKVEYMKDVHDYYRYQHSIYEQSMFRKYDNCRSEIQDYITKIAIWFITLHEYSHITNGHLKYLAYRKNKCEKAPKNEIRAMELHADLSAADELLRIMFCWEKKVGTNQRIVKLDGKYPGVTYFDDVIIGIIAAYISMRCFLKKDFWDEYSIGMYRGDNDDHPITELRMAVIFNAFVGGMMDHYPKIEDKKQFAYQAYTTVQQFEKFYFVNKGKSEPPYLTEINYVPTELLRTEKGKEYYKEVFDDVLQLNQTLERFKYVMTKIDGTWVDYETLPERLFWN